MMDRRTLIGTGIAAAAASAMPGAALAQNRITVPFKLFDCHAHFYTNKPDEYPFHANGARYGAEAMIKKAMAHPMTAETILKMWDETGVGKGLGVQYNSTYSTDNRYLLDIAGKYPDRILPVVILDPLDHATPLTLELMAQYRGVTGVRFTGVMKDGEFGFLSDAAAGAWEAANALGLSITVMPLGHAPEAMGKVAAYAAKYPNVYIVIDHIGFPRPVEGGDFGLSPQHIALAGHKNVFYKYTTFLIEMLQAGNVPLGPFLEHMVETYGADHMVWGSDVGNTEGTYSDFVQTALQSAKGLGMDQQKALFHDTAERVFIPGGRGA